MNPAASSSPHWKLDLRQNLLHHPPINIRQPVIPPRVAEREPLVVEAEEVEDGGVEVVDVDLVLYRAEAEVVGRPVGQAAADAAAGQPGSEAPVVVVAPLSRQPL